MVIKKSLRTRFRYIKFRLLSAHPFHGDFEGELRAHINTLLGLSHAPSIKLLSFDSEGNGLLRCDSASFTEVRQAMLFFYDKDYRIKLLKSSGTIGSLIGES